MSLESKLREVKDNLPRVDGFVQGNSFENMVEGMQSNILDLYFQQKVYKYNKHLVKKHIKVNIDTDVLTNYVTTNLKDWDFYLTSTRLFLYSDEFGVFIYGNINYSDKAIFSVNVYANPAYLYILEDEFILKLSNPIEKKIKWCYYDKDKNIEETRVSLKQRDIYNEMYPQLNIPIKEYYDSFLKSESNILILIGDPGTGKTTFINGLLYMNNVIARISYDKNLLQSDEFLNEFIINEDDNTLVFEDADAFLLPRDEGNDMMHKFLSIGDGLVSNKNKKIIFSTNLKSEDEIDPALTRKGRCFDILHFRPLNKDEAKALCKVANLDVELVNKTYTLSELFNSNENGSGNKPKYKVGFI